MYYLKGQKHYDDCATAVTATILGLYGREYNYKKLGNIRSFLDIVVTLEKFNIEVSPCLDETLNSFPCIIQTRRFKKNHFMVIYEEKDNFFTYFSPNKFFIHRIKKERLLKYYTHKVIYIKNKEDYQPYCYNLKSIPYSIKLIIFDVITLILIYNILTSML